MGAPRPRCRMLLVVLLKQKLSLNPEITIHWMVTVDILLNAMGLSFTFWKMGIFMILTHYIDPSSTDGNTMLHRA